MKTFTASKFRANMSSALAYARDYEEPVIITTKSGNFVTVSEEDWNAIQETLRVKSIPGIMQEVKSVKDGTDNPVNWRSL